MSDDWRTRKPDIFADAPAFAKERIRYEIATSRIAGSRLTGSGTSDEENFVKAGYRDAHEYWQDAMSEPMKALSFTHLLKQHQLDPSCDPNNLLQLSLESALCLALRTGETWFIRDPHKPERGPDDLNRLMLHPRRAAEWLMSLRKRKQLVPPGLRAFLEPGERHDEPMAISSGFLQEPKQSAHPTLEETIAAIKVILAEGPLKKETVRSRLLDDGNKTPLKKIFEDAWKKVPESMKLARGQKA